MKNKANYLSDYWFWRGEYTSRNMDYMEVAFDLENAWNTFTSSDEYPQNDSNLACYIWEKFDCIVSSDVPIDECDWAGPVACSAGILGRTARKLIETKFPAGGSPANANCILTMLATGRPVRDAVACRLNPVIFDSSELWEEMGSGKVRLAKFGGDLSTLDLSFDLNLETEVLIANARRFIEWAKDYTVHCKFGETPSKRFQQSPESYGRSVEELYRCTRKGKSYQTRSDASRAIGLWLWDYMQENNGTAKTAILAIKEHFGTEVKTLGFATTEENVYRSWLRRTKECIDACDVLAFT